MVLSNEEIETRIERARALFHAGYNCSQSVVASCADLFGVSEEVALRMAASFGGGIGRMRMVCGAASGMFMLEGLRSGSAVQGDAQGKARNYAEVQNLAARFKEENGSLICAELLGIAPRPENPQPAERTPAYYQKRPCADMVACAVRIFLENNNKPQ